MERVQGPEHSVAPAEAAVPSLAPTGSEGPRLPEAVARARELPGSAGAGALQEVERLLRALQPSAPDGELLLSLLEARSFDGLAGDDGTPTRVLAIEALLRLGYPWSIQVQPEDLAWYRAQQQRRGKTRLMILLGILAVELVGAGYLWLFT